MKETAALLLGLLMLLLTAAPAHAEQVAEPKHWSSKVIYVDEAVGTFWPIYQTDDLWEASGAVNLPVRHACPLGAPCIWLDSARWASCHVVGITRMAWVGDIMVGAHITMNRACNHVLPYSLRRAALAHELGHALGLFHDTWPYSIMYPAVWSGNAVPTAYDLGVLRNEYQ